MCGEVAPVPDAAALLAAIDSRLSRAERMLADALGPVPRPGALYLGLLELAREMKSDRLTVEGMKILFDAACASVLAGQAAEAEAARVPCQVVRLHA